MQRGHSYVEKKAHTFDSLPPQIVRKALFSCTNMSETMPQLRNLLVLTCYYASMPISSEVFCNFLFRCRLEVGDIWVVSQHSGYLLGIPIMQMI